MRNIIQYLLKRREVKRQLRLFINNPLFKIVYLKDSSLILGCLGAALNERGNRVITWNNVIIFNETKKISLSKYVKKLYKDWKKSNKTLEDFMNIKAQKFSNEINDLLIKFKLNVKPNTVTIDFLNESGIIVFRGIRENIEKYFNFIKKTENERRKLISEMNERIALKGNKYKPENAIAKGYDDIPISKGGKGASPDFDGLIHYLYNNDPAFGKVRIKVTGSRDKDFKQCLELMNLKKTPKGYTWHHLDDLDENLECTMQLVLRDAHEATVTHLGSAGQFNNLLGIKEEYL
ncbi:HNH endonuclease [Tenacibaculum aiptasiae]|uniref:HNH endonuclease n=1 Tax=Tenacibaculum aiptasiae TaxID=426481 RepID=A0A7J5AN29_9FLAO|nr:HNH endonuclease [Tenacibaculum aiptasiae]KAB1158920.1 HNH endonuclease [Tenacibaculum aiptasiae]